MPQFKSIGVLLIGLVLLAPGPAGAQDTPAVAQTIGVNPLGLIIDGLSYVEYTRSLTPQVSATFRLDYIKYSDDEEEVEGYSDVYRWEYEEEGKGPGAGIGVRAFFPMGKSVDFVVGSGLEIVQISWEWTDTSYRDDGSLNERDSDDGATTAFAFHGGLGVKIKMGQSKFFIEPQIIFGSLAMDVERSDGESFSGTGFFVGPVVVAGIGF